MRPRRRCGAVRICTLLCGLLPLAGSLAAPPLPTATKAGDLIFRQGTEGVSQLVRAVDRGDFSHVGLLVAPAQPDGVWQVLHATPSEHPGQPDAVVLDTLDFYLAAERTRAYRIYQVGASAAARQQAMDWAQAQRGRPFDLLDAERGRYCTTLVWQAWQHAGLDLEVSFTHIAMPVIGGQFLLPSALQASRHVQLLAPLSLPQSSAAGQARAQPVVLPKP